MQAPINEYYTDKEYEYALLQMKKMMERNRALAEAKAAMAAREKLRKDFLTKSKEIAGETKGIITSINSQMDAAIKGEVRKSLEMYIPNLLSKYDHIGD